MAHQSCAILGRFPPGLPQPVDDDHQPDDAIQVLTRRRQAQRRRRKRHPAVPAALRAGIGQDCHRTGQRGQGFDHHLAGVLDGEGVDGQEQAGQGTDQRQGQHFQHARHRRRFAGHIQMGFWQRAGRAGCGETFGNLICLGQPGQRRPVDQLSQWRMLRAVVELGQRTPVAFLDGRRVLLPRPQVIVLVVVYGQQVNRSEPQHQSDERNGHDC